MTRLLSLLLDIVIFRLFFFFLQVMRVEDFFFIFLTQLSKKSDSLPMWEFWWYFVMEEKTRIKKRKINVVTELKGHS